MSSYGLWRIHHASNNRVAWEDWHKLAAEATALGYGDLAAKLAPLEGAGWRRVDKCWGRLKTVLEKAQVLVGKGQGKPPEASTSHNNYSVSLT